MTSDEPKAHRQAAWERMRAWIEWATHQNEPRPRMPSEEAQALLAKWRATPGGRSISGMWEDEAPMANGNSVMRKWRDRTPYWADPLNGHFNCAGRYVMPPKPAGMWPEDTGRANWGHKYRTPGRKRGPPVPLCWLDDLDYMRSPDDAYDNARYRK